MKNRIILVLIIMGIAFLAAGCNFEKRNTYVRLVSDYLTKEDVMSRFDNDMENGYIAEDIQKNNEVIFLCMTHSQHFKKGDTLKVKLVSTHMDDAFDIADISTISFDGKKQIFKKYKLNMFEVLEAELAEVEKQDEVKK
jgi:hypothetical protein